MYGTNLERVDLAKADLLYADLRDTNLRDAKLREANLHNADLRGADITTNIVRLDGMPWTVTIIEGYMRIGRHCHHVDTWDAFSDNDITEIMPDISLRDWLNNKQQIMTIAKTTKPEVRKAVHH